VSAPVPSEQAQRFFALLQEYPPLLGEELHLHREAIRQLCFATGGDPDEVASVEDLEAGGVPSRLYHPAGGERDVLVYFHGGGWIVQDLDTFDTTMRRLANEAGCAVLNVDYRLAPEHPYPAAVEDCWAATRWAVAQFDRVAVGGDSAGGNLAAAIAHRARDAGLPLVLQLLVYPAVDAVGEIRLASDWAERYRDFAGIEGYGPATRDGGASAFAVYIQDESRLGERDASPLRADSFEGLAAALIVLAEHDILNDEAREYARRLRAAGVDAEVVEYEGEIHGFFQMLGLMEDAGHAVARAGAALRSAFGGRPPGLDTPQLVRSLEGRTMWPH
jgi:acetyl esterase